MFEDLFAIKSVPASAMVAVIQDMAIKAQKKTCSIFFSSRLMPKNIAFLLAFLLFFISHMACASNAKLSKAQKALISAIAKKRTAGGMPRAIEF